ncbi:hypothetical protein CC86DRAFT_65204 [Ophiobolus disseminans]|uniref:Protein YAE1 n=1 Tax=Ophiobolus disseminans TaxID=1469910 RepID=A0A6A6ZSG4_9PLEO|nr:hypothetical protein CC86DRAFT_65204 [Ophiobolus disseminans]
MNAFCETSPHLGPTELAAGHAPPTPPHDDPLDDIYGSAPASPTFHDASLSNLDTQRERPHEILSDLPSRRRALDTDAYREGLANSKGQYVQEGFDEGYSLGANLGMRIGYIFGVLQGLVAAWKGQNADLYYETKEAYTIAQKELAIQELLGQQWVNEEGIWKWEVHGEEDDPTFREVAEQHPIVHKWTVVVEDMAGKWGVDTKAVENVHHDRTEEQS